VSTLVRMRSFESTAAVAESFASMLSGWREPTIEAGDAIKILRAFGLHEDEAHETLADAIDRGLLVREGATLRSAWRRAARAEGER